MIVNSDGDVRIDQIRQRFLLLTGLSTVELTEEPAGPEMFLRFTVGRDAPLYRSALSAIDQELPSDDPFHGRLSLLVERKRDVLYSMEIEVLRSLIVRSLRVTSDRIQEGPLIDFIPFGGGEENRVIQPVNHAILGRRGVGKSTLILIAYKRIVLGGNIPVWVDLQAYHGRTDYKAALEILLEIFKEIIEILKRDFVNCNAQPLVDATHNIQLATGETQGKEVSVDYVRKLVPQLRLRVRDFTRTVQKQIFIFIDDGHLLGPELQPVVFDIIHSLFKGAGGYLKVAGVKNLLCLYDPATMTGLQPPNDIQLIPLDLTLVDPAAAREHLIGVLQRFLTRCGLKGTGEIIHSRAIDRLVWCSAGVPRDFLWLFDRSIGFAIQHRRKRIGVQEVNLAVGEFGQEKMAELEQDTTEKGDTLRNSLNRLQRAALDQYKSNSFLIRQETDDEGYKSLQKLVDLRLVHLIHPSITPSRSGEKYEAYLLDYSFYTGLRRRHGLSEIKIKANEPPKYETLRRLPKIGLNTLQP